MVQEEIFSQLRLRIVNFCIQSYMFCISFIPFLPVWIQIRILNKNAQSCWITDPIFFYPDPQHCLQPLIITQNNHNFTLKSNRNWLHAHVGTPCRVTHTSIQYLWNDLDGLLCYGHILVLNPEEEDGLVGVWAVHGVGVDWAPLVHHHPPHVLHGDPVVPRVTATLKNSNKT